MKYSTVKLKTGLAGIWKGIFKGGGGGVFMRNYASGGRPADNLIGFQEVIPPEKDYPWNPFAWMSVDE